MVILLGIMCLFDKNESMYLTDLENNSLSLISFLNLCCTGSTIPMLYMHQNEATRNDSNVISLCVVLI